MYRKKEAENCEEFGKVISLFPELVSDERRVYSEWYSAAILWITKAKKPPVTNEYRQKYIDLNIISLYHACIRSWN